MTLPTPSNPFKAALCAGRPQIGLWQALGSPYTAEICATAGFDWLLLDAEHGPNTLSTILPQLQAIAGHPSHPVVRLPAGETRLIKQYLDIGAASLLIPFVESAEQAQALVAAVRYPPDGVRGVASGLVRASRWGLRSDYLHAADLEICLLLQIETPRGVENLDAILDVEGVDGVFIGPADLSAAMGHRGDPGHEAVQAEIAHAIGRIRARGRAAGILATDPAHIRRYRELGCVFVAVGSDVAILAQGARALASNHIERS